MRGGVLLGFAFFPFSFSGPFLRILTCSLPFLMRLVQGSGALRRWVSLRRAAAVQILAANSSRWFCIEEVCARCLRCGVECGFCDDFSPFRFGVECGFSDDFCSVPFRRIAMHSLLCLCPVRIWGGGSCCGSLVMRFAVLSLQACVVMN